MTPTQFEASQKASMRRSQLQRAIRGTSVVPPSSFRRFLNLAFENRVVTTATISPESIAGELNVTDEMVVAYYDENLALYNLPESADIQYVEILRDSVVSTVDVTEEQLQEYYELEKDRFQRLEKIGFQWDPQADQWEERFAELKAFKKKYGHCNVPLHCKEKPQLARWVSKQRTVKARGKLSPDRIKRLEEIGFQWSFK